VVTRDVREAGGQTVSYRERQLRKDRRGKTPAELRKALPGIYAGQVRWQDELPEGFTTYRLEPDGSMTPVMTGTVSR
jgi:hypothetical protein